MVYVSHIFAKNVPIRLCVCVMIFVMSFVSYMLRVNFSINVIAMSEKFNWSKTDQGLLLSAYFYGYIFPNLFGGFLAQKFGGRIVIFLTMFMSSIVTAVSAIEVHKEESFLFIFTLRVLLGIFGGFFYPAAHSVIACWSPVEEKGKFISSLMGGGVLGTVATLFLTGLIIEKLNWQFGFYIPAFFALFASILWYLVVNDSPSSHSWISKDEKDFLEKSLNLREKSAEKKKSMPPLIEMFKSPAFWALNILHFGNVWGLYFLLTAAPKFLNEVFGFNLAKVGFLASLPYLFRLIFGFIFGSLGDKIRQKNLITVTNTRKSFCIFSHVIPGLLLATLCYIGDHPYICVSIITFSLGFNGAATVTNLQNSQDLAPNYAGSIYGIINFFGTTSGFISPVVVGYFTAEQSTMEEWRYIFAIGAIAYILPALIFAVYGSGDVQKWNASSEEERKEQEIDKNAT